MSYQSISSVPFHRTFRQIFVKEVASVVGQSQIAGIARENAAVAEEVSAWTEKLTPIAGSVVEVAAGLKGVAAELEAETDRFRA